MNMNLIRVVHLKKEVLTFTGFMFEIMIMIILILILTFIITVIS